MTETTLPQDDLEDLQPAEVSMNAVLLLLAPMFLNASRGRFDLACMAALDTLSVYRIGNSPDRIATAQIVACGLASLGSLGQSMTSDISLSMALRLRNNANALNRSADQHRRAVQAAETMLPHEPEQFHPADAQREAEVEASVADTQKRLAATRKRLAEAQSSLNIAAPPPIPTQPAGQTPAPVPTQPPESTPPLLTTPPPAHSAPMLNQQRQDAIWAAGMIEVAAEYTASLAFLPPAERKQASARAAALSSSANALLLGDIPPPMRPLNPLD
jgi:hypothetical protein